MLPTWLARWLLVLYCIFPFLILGAGRYNLFLCVEYFYPDDYLSSISFSLFSFFTGAFSA